MNRLTTILSYPVELLRAWRTSNALDKTSTKRTTPLQHVAREQAVMHALLRSREQVPVHQPDPNLRRKIAMKLQDTTPVSVRRSSSLDALRVGAVPALVAVALAVGVHVAGTRMTTSPSTTPVASTEKPATTGAHVANGSGDPLNPGAKATGEFGNRAVTASDLITPVTFPIGTGHNSTGALGSRPSRATDDASISSMPLVREANALQQAVPLVREAIMHRLPPMPERPK